MKTVVMKSKRIDYRTKPLIIALLILGAITTQAFADRPGPSTSLRTGWQKEQADWRLSASTCIKSITYPQEKPPPIRAKRAKPVKPRRKRLSPDPLRRIEFLTAGTVESIYASVIDSPPVDGFVPYIAVSVTDARSDETDPEAAIFAKISPGNMV